MTRTSSLSSSEARQMYDKPHWYEPGSLAHYLAVAIGTAPVTFKPPLETRMTPPPNPRVLKTLGRFFSTLFLTGPHSTESDSSKLQNFSQATQIRYSTARTGQEVLAQLHREDNPGKESFLQAIIHEAKKPGRLPCIQELIDTARKQGMDELTDLFPDIFFSLAVLYGHSQTEKREAGKICLKLLEMGMPLKPYRSLGTPLEAACILGYPQIVQRLLENAPKNLEPNDPAFEPYKRATFAVYDQYRIHPENEDIYQIIDEFGKFFCQAGITPYQQRNSPSIAFRGALSVLKYDFESNPESYPAYDQFRLSLCQQNALFSDTAAHRSDCDSAPRSEDPKSQNWVSSIQRTILWIEDLIGSRNRRGPLETPPRPYDFGTLKNHPTLHGVHAKPKTSNDIMQAVQAQMEKEKPDVEYLFSLFIDLIVPAPKPQWEFIDRFLDILHQANNHPIIIHLKMEMFCSTLSFFAENDEEYENASKFCIKLIDSGFNINDRINAIGEATALHAAIYLQYWDVVEKLIDDGADVCRCDIRSQSPIRLLKHFIDNEGNFRTKLKLQRLAKKVGEKCKEHERFKGQGLENVGPAAFQKAAACEEASLKRHRPMVKQPRRASSGLEFRLPSESAPAQEFRVLISSPLQEVEVPQALIDFPEWVMKKYGVGTLRSPVAAKRWPTATEVLQR